MKRHIFILLLLPSLLFAEYREISPRVCSSFGEVSQIEASFVEKPNTYYAQNLVKEPFYLKVFSVNGRPLEPQVLIEYKLDVDTTQAPYTLNKFLCFETLTIEGLPRTWDPQPAQMDYSIISYLLIKPITKE